jgi:hypothetical protein
MSEVRLTVRDARRDLHATRHGSFADAVLAALSAEPETLEELDTALERFCCASEWGFFRGFTPGVRDEPHDAGLVIVDMAARLVVWDSTYGAPQAAGAVPYHDGHGATELWLRYRLSDDWQVTSGVSDWRSLAERRRRERAANPPLDARAVLYGRPVLEFIAAECWAAFSGPRHAAESDGDSDVVRGIHARWLLTAREDLRGQAPRDVLLARHDLVTWDLQYRAEQWSEQGACPRGLDPESHGFRYAGFGTHELVTYYDLLRHLLGSCRERLRERPAPARDEFLPAEVLRLERLRDGWLDTPDPENHGLPPREIIDHERARLPEAMSGHEAVIDHDCPLCEMMADLPGPVFWHLDGCNMDDDFAFSFHRTRAEWEEEQRRHEEFDRWFEEKEAERKRLGLDDPPMSSGSVWQRSFAAPEAAGGPPSLRLFTVGSMLAELIVDLKQPVEDRSLIDGLRQAFGNLRAVVSSGDGTHGAALLEPVLDRLWEAVEAVAATRDDLRPKCADLQQQLRRFLEPSDPGPHFQPPDDEDVPF